MKGSNNLKRWLSVELLKNHACGPSRLTIQFTPNLSLHMPKQGGQKVLPIGMKMDRLAMVGAACFAEDAVDAVIESFRSYFHRLPAPARK